MVPKRSDSRYRSGTSRDWIKVKNPEHPAMRRVADTKRRKERNVRNDADVPKRSL